MERLRMHSRRIVGILKQSFSQRRFSFAALTLGILSAGPFSRPPRAVSAGDNARPNASQIGKGSIEVLRQSHALRFAQLRRTVGDVAHEIHECAPGALPAPAHQPRQPSA